MNPASDESPGSAPSDVCCGRCGMRLMAALGWQCPRCLLGLGTVDATREEGGARDTVAGESRRFGDYELLEEIARGGMGVVFRARHLSLNRVVALKMILAGELAGRESLDRFRREARAAAHLHHAHIVPVHEIGEHELQHYFTMRLVPGGRNIADWAADRRGDWKAVTQAMAQVARAVAHAHSHGVLHRDLKPSNILWDDAAGPQVTDFGLAKLMDEADGTVTVSARVLGSPNYMAPEQAQGDVSAITTATDVYGLGAVLYELLSGQPPFAGSTAIETLRRVVEESPVPLVGVPVELRTICLQCLAKRPSDRYRSAASLADDLERFARGEAVSAVPVTTLQAMWRWACRRPQMAVLLGVSLLSLLTALVGITWQWRKAERAHRGESQALEKATATVVDLYTRSGLTAADNGASARAALWFAQAAVAAPDPERRALELARHMAWRGEATTAVRAFESGIGPVRQIHWNPAQTALILRSRRSRECAIWDLPSEKRWQPEGAASLSCATWAVRASWVAYHSAGRVRVVDYPGGRVLAEREVEGPVSCIAVSPDDRWVAVGGTDPFLWEHAGGRTEPLPEGWSSLTGLEFSRDGRHVLLTGPGKRAVCAVAEPGSVLHPPVLALGLQSVGFLGDGSEYFTVTPEGRTEVRETRTGRVVESYDGSSDTNELVAAVSPDGRFLGRHTLPVIQRGAPPASFPRHKNRFESVDFSRDGQWMLTGSFDAVVRMWHLPEGTPGPLIGSHQVAVTAAAISPDQRRVASAQLEGFLVRVWALPEPVAYREVPLSVNSGIELSADGRLFALRGWASHADALRRTRVHRIADGAPVGPEMDAEARIVDAGFAPDGSWLVLACWEPGAGGGAGSDAVRAIAGLQFWDHRTGRRLGGDVALPAEPRRLSVSPAGDRVGVYDVQGRLMEVDVRTRAVLMRHDPGLDPAERGYGDCRYSPDGNLLVGWGLGLESVVWDRGAERMRRIGVATPTRVMDVAFHGGVMALVPLESRVDFVSVDGLQPVTPSIQDSDWLFVGRFSPDGGQFLSGGRSSLARLWDWKKGTLVCPALQHEGEVFSGAFVPGTDGVATGGLDALIRLWDRRTGLPLRPPLPQESRVMEFVVTPDGDHLIRGNYFGTGIRIYRLADLRPSGSLPAVDAQLLGELDAAVEVRNGGLEPLGAAAWIQRWQRFRGRHPDWHRW